MKLNSADLALSTGVQIFSKYKIDFNYQFDIILGISRKGRSWPL